jgi:flavin reductase (DIM6/NTAB) family NADH-FMN oxidoreductase RutF
MKKKLYDTYDTPTHDLFIGEIVQSYADKYLLSEGKVDITKVKPLLFDMGSIKYWSLGEAVADCWSIGKKLKKK